MKTLFLLRHGKSDWDSTTGRDHDRPLANRGIKAASIMGRFMESVGQIPDRIISSTAARAHETAKRAVAAGNWNRTVDTHKRVYGYGADEIIELVQSCEETVGSLLLVGHEPACSTMTGRLVGGAAVRFPTAGMVRIDFSVENWESVSFGKGILIWFVTPKLLKELHR